MAANGGVGEDGGDMNHAVEAFFAGSENSVVMAFHVAKSQASWSVAGRRTRHSTKPRVLALTGMWIVVVRLMCNFLMVLGLSLWQCGGVSVLE